MTFMYKKKWYRGLQDSFSGKRLGLLEVLSHISLKGKVLLKVNTN